MEGIGLTVDKKNKLVRQPPSVPFLWELKPGIPKKDWKPEPSSLGHTPKPPLRLIASIPFAWEEAPGKPLNSSKSPPVELIFSDPQPSAEDTVYCNKSEFNGNKDSDYVCQQGCYSDEQDWISELVSESVSYETDDSFRSVPSLLANRLLPSAKMSTALAQKKSLPSEVKSNQLEIPNSPNSESGSSISSYATGCSSPTGAAFLERIFPLFPPKPSFLEKVGNSEIGTQTPLEPMNRNSNQEYNSGVILRRPPTLGELIMMSRRRSCQRKAVQMRKQNLSMEIKPHKHFGCFMFKTGGNTIQGIHKQKKFLPRLKLV